MIATRMMCPEPLPGRVLAYTVALSKVSTYAIENGKLVLKGRGGSRLAVFEAEIGDLTGSSWTVSAYNDGQEAVVSVLIGTEISARFGDDQRITGHAGCNGFFASYQAQNESISVGPPGATRKFCGEPEGIMEQESRFLAALETASIFRITGKKLELRTAEGSLAMTLLRADPKE